MISAVGFRTARPGKSDRPKTVTFFVWSFSRAVTFWNFCFLYGYIITRPIWFQYRISYVLVFCRFLKKLRNLVFPNPNPKVIIRVFALPVIGPGASPFHANLRAFNISDGKISKKYFSWKSSNSGTILAHIFWCRLTGFKAIPYYRFGGWSRYFCVFKVSVAYQLCARVEASTGHPGIYRCGLHAPWEDALWPTRAGPT